MFEGCVLSFNYSKDLADSNSDLRKCSSLNNVPLSPGFNRSFRFDATTRTAIAIGVEIRKYHTHIDLLTGTKAYREVIVSIDISSSGSFFNGELTLENFLMPRAFLKPFYKDHV